MCDSLGWQEQDSNIACEQNLLQILLTLGSRSTDSMSDPNNCLQDEKNRVLSTCCGDDEIRPIFKN